MSAARISASNSRDQIQAYSPARFRITQYRAHFNMLALGNSIRWERAVVQTKVTRVRAPPRFHGGAESKGTRGMLMGLDQQRSWTRGLWGGVWTGESRLAEVQVLLLAGGPCAGKIREGFLKEGVWEVMEIQAQGLTEGLLVAFQCLKGKGGVREVMVNRETRTVCVLLRKILRILRLRGGESLSRLRTV